MYASVREIERWCGESRNSREMRGRGGDMDSLVRSRRFLFSHSTETVLVESDCLDEQVGSAEPFDEVAELVRNGVGISRHRSVEGKGAMVRPLGRAQSISWIMRCRKTWVILWKNKLAPHSVPAYPMGRAER